MKLTTISKWLFRLYIVWSICVDIMILGGIVYLLMDTPLNLSIF